MKKLVWTPPTQPSLEELKWFRFLVGRFGGYDGTPVVVSRTGYTGELGYEVFCHPDDGAAVWDAIWEAGAAARAEAARARGARHDPHRGRPDLRRLRVRRPGRPVRGRHRLHGQARLRGRLRGQGGAASSARRTRSASSSGLELEGNETAGHGDEVWVGRRRVGVVTSGTRSPTLRKNVALCRMAVQYSELGDRASRSASSTASRSGSPRSVVRIPVLRPRQDASRARERSRPRPAEFDFPISWSGPDGIGASPFDEFAESRGAGRVRRRTRTRPWRCAGRSGCSPPG